MHPININPASVCLANEEASIIPLHIQRLHVIRAHVPVIDCTEFGLGRLSRKLSRKELRLADKLDTQTIFPVEVSVSGMGQM